MPFVQRVVQPTCLVQVSATAVVDRTRASRYCQPGKCHNNNCINNTNNNNTTTISKQTTNVADITAASIEQQASESNALSRTVANVKDKDSQEQQQITTTITKAVIHVSQQQQQQNGDAELSNAVLLTTTTTTTSSSTPTSPQHYNQTNGFACSFSYATDTEEQPSPSSPPPVPSMKKLKQHVEFLSTAPSPSRSLSRGGDAPGSRSSSHSRQQQQLRQRAQSPTAAKIVSGYEFESISNITLSNALRQLASLVLIASDIFEELQGELQAVNERTRCVQRKIIAVERKVTAYDPKMVTVPESDLLTFAQRKTHYDGDKSFRKELFTATTRPRSVRVLYEEAGKITPPTTPAHSPHSPHAFVANGDGGIMVDGDGVPVDGISSTGALTADSDELVCTPVFGKANRKMRTRIDAEIEIRLPAAIEDLRKWTSSEALGDVTVTPDCLHHVDTSISTSMVIGDNGILTPALSPSVLSADAVDALYSINTSHVGDITQLPNDINKDVPLNHRLPSPEEQCKIIALKYPAEVISVDTSGKRFQRMCMARKSTTGCYTTSMADANNLNDDVQTVSRRSRSRKVRGKRRNTIAGTDQKEIQDAANGDTTATSSELKGATADVAATTAAKEDTPEHSKSKKFGRSKSSDILKKDSVALPYDKGKNTLTRLNSLKQWGRNRFKFMQRTESSPPATTNDSGAHDVSGISSNSSGSTAPPAGNDKAETPASVSGSSTKANSGKSSATTSSSAGRDIDDECVVHELISQKSESRFSHERKPSYSSSEKSMSVSSSGHLKGKLHLATCGNVKLRDTSSLNRQRRHGISANGGLTGKEEQPHSSSGNWSASSESGRASIGSEITIQPKSSASNTSLNVSSFHPGSGPPSSMMSRRRFFNTSASSSVTSEGTATPDLQVADGSYPNHLDDETSSAYSCDTEGYYTSFHMDSGLRTLKEEEPPMTPLQRNQNLHTSNYSFGSQSNQTVLTAENEYELFGRGSTSTTTSSAGTVCTTLMVNGEQSSLNSVGPDVPERISSLGKLNKSNHSNSASTSTLERSYSSSTIGSTLERTGTIKRNVNANLKLSTAEADNIDGMLGKKSTDTPESQDEEFDFEQRMRRRAAQPLPSVSIVSEIECSECSDLEGVERIERIKQKTTINAKRIPSMCIITPTTSDDENQSKDGHAFDADKTLTNESSPYSKAATNAEAKLQLEINEGTGYCTVGNGGAKVVEAPSTPTKMAGHKDHNLNVLKRNSNYALNNMFEKLKVVLPSIKRSPHKSAPPESVLEDDELYDTAGEYVTIADISNNNRHNQLPAAKAVGASSLGIYYSNDIVRRRLDSGAAERAKGDEPVRVAARQRETEYVSLNELPQHLRKIALQPALHNEMPPTMTTTAAAGDEQRQSTSGECAESAKEGELAAAVPMYAEISEVREQSLVAPLTQHKGARVRVNSQGKIIYDSDSLKRRKGAHTTFAPGPYVKETESALPEIASTEQSQSPSGSESAPNAAVKSGLVAKTAAAKLLLLNGGIAANRKVANVRPIVAASPLTQQTQQRQQQQQQPASINSGSNMYTINSYQDSKNMLANNTNPFFQCNVMTSNGTAMMPSPSTKSTSSTGSTVSSSNSTLTSGSSASSNKDEGYQRFYKTNPPQLQMTQPQPPQYETVEQPSPSSPATAVAATPFQRNSPIYWTLQNRRQSKPVSSNVTCRDDLYATPIRRSERVARAAANSGSASSGNSNISPIVPRSRGAFQTSTPTHDGQSENAYTPCKQPLGRSAHWDDNSPERFNTCSDRIGHSKTSLMDFKKLLLAKSAKTSPVQKKLSAVEMLKKSSSPTPTGANNAKSNTAEGNTNGAIQAVNSSMKLLDLSGSPKTFANRRMLRQGQFGSPSKSFAPKMKTPPGGGPGGERTASNGWRGNASQRTDIMSTTIPEANSEEDQSNSSKSSSSSSATSNESTNANVDTSSQCFDLKRNFFLQTEENNFMRGELKAPFVKGSATAGVSNSKVASEAAGNHNGHVGAKAEGIGGANSATAAAAPALETAL